MVLVVEPLVVCLSENLIPSNYVKIYETRCSNGLTKKYCPRRK